MDKSKDKLVTDLVNKVKNLNDKEKLEDLLKNNNAEFTIDKINYRVSKPNGSQNKELRRARNERFFQLLKDPAFKLKEILIKELKEKGYDIIAEELKIKEIGYTIEDIENKVAEVPTESTQVLKDYEKEVDELKQKQAEISVRIDELMEFSIEQELLEFSNNYLIYSVLDKENEVGSEKQWDKAFKTYEEYLDSDNEPLRLESLYYMSMITFKPKV